MKKDTVKKKAVKGNPYPEVRSVLRAFILSHQAGYGEAELEDLKIYLDAYHGLHPSGKDLELLIVKEKKSIAVEMKAMHMEEDLFSPPAGDRPVKLGSCFCPGCSRFKNYKKECPHCGHHEMTV